MLYSRRVSPNVYDSGWKREKYHHFSFHKIGHLLKPTFYNHESVTRPIFLPSNFKSWVKFLSKTS